MQQIQHPNRSPRLYFILGLLASIILYTAYNLYILDPYVYERMGRSTRHIYKFGSIILSWLIGYLAFRKFSPTWVLQLWHFLFAAGLLLLLILAAWDILINPLPPYLKQPVSTFHEAL